MSEQVTIELSDDEVLVALKRVEGYEDVHPELVTEDAIRDNWPEYRTIHGDELVVLAADRVDVAKVRAVIALIRSYSCEPDDLEAHWAEELESALGKETGS